MAGHGVNPSVPGSNAAVRRYRADLSALVRGPRKIRRRVLAEVTDGLIETIDANAANGMPPDAAADKAIREFGDPATVAASFADELAAASARRTIAAFVLTGPMVGIWWLLLLHPAPWRTGIAATLGAIPALPLIAAAIAAAVGTFATTGRLMRWLPETTGARALNAARSIAGLAIAADMTVLGVLAGHSITGHRYPVALAAAAAAASIARIWVALAVIRSTRAASVRHEAVRTSSASSRTISADSSLPLI